MIRIAITPAAFKAICATLPLGGVACEPELDGEGRYLVWVDERTVNQLTALRGKRESYSDAIIRLAASQTCVWNGGNSFGPTRQG